MREVTETAFGKLNLTLDVLGRREDGYHDMCMIMQSVSLCDEVTVSLTDDGNWSCFCDVAGVPADQDNLALKAAKVFYEKTGQLPAGLHVTIAKNIPMQGGMAGGSADAAAVLRALNRLHGMPFSAEELADMGAFVGSDVPYCVIGKTVLAEGKGELLRPLPDMPRCWYVLVRPEFSVSTPALFRKLDGSAIEKRPDTEKAIACLQRSDLSGFCGCVHNVFQPVLEQEHPVIADICAKLKIQGALTASLTGTGSVVYGIFDDPHTAQRAKTALETQFWVCLAENV